MPRIRNKDRTIKILKDPPGKDQIYISLMKDELPKIRGILGMQGKRGPHGILSFADDSASSTGMSRGGSGAIGSDQRTAAGSEAASRSSSVSGGSKASGAAGTSGGPGGQGTGGKAAGGSSSQGAAGTSGGPGGQGTGGGGAGAGSSGSGSARSNNAATGDRNYGGGPSTSNNAGQSKSNNAATGDRNYGGATSGTKGGNPAQGTPASPGMSTPSPGAKQSKANQGSQPDRGPLGPQGQPSGFNNRGLLGGNPLGPPLSSEDRTRTDRSATQDPANTNLTNLDEPGGLLQTITHPPGSPQFGEPQVNNPVVNREMFMDRPRSYGYDDQTLGAFPAIGNDAYDNTGVNPTSGLPENLHAEEFMGGPYVENILNGARGLTTPEWPKSENIEDIRDITNNTNVTKSPTTDDPDMDLQNYATPPGIPALEPYAKPTVGPTHRALGLTEEQLARTLPSKTPSAPTYDTDPTSLYGEEPAYTPPHGEYSDQATTRVSPTVSPAVSTATVAQPPLVKDRLEYRTLQSETALNNRMRQAVNDTMDVPRTVSGDPRAEQLAEQGLLGRIKTAKQDVQDGYPGRGTANPPNYSDTNPPRAYPNKQNQLSGYPGRGTVNPPNYTDANPPRSYPGAPQAVNTAAKRSLLGNIAATSPPWEGQNWPHPNLPGPIAGADVPTPFNPGRGVVNPPNYTDSNPPRAYPGAPASVRPSTQTADNARHALDTYDNMRTARTIADADTGRHILDTLDTKIGQERARRAYQTSDTARHATDNYDAQVAYEPPPRSRVLDNAAVARHQYDVARRVEPDANVPTPRDKPEVPDNSREIEARVEARVAEVKDKVKVNTETDISDRVLNELVRRYQEKAEWIGRILNQFKAAHVHGGEGGKGRSGKRAGLPPPRLGNRRYAANTNVIPANAPRLGA